MFLWVQGFNVQGSKVFLCDRVYEKPFYGFDWFNSFYWVNHNHGEFKFKVHHINK